jgi:gliding motility-associated-like protein
MKGIKWILFLLFIVAQVNLYAQPTPPILTCTQVNTNGSVEVFWQNFNTPGNTLDSLRFFFSNNLNGVYTQSVATTNAAVSQINIPLAAPNANTQAYHFFARAYYNSSANPFLTDTVSSIYLNLNNATEGLAQLSWNAIRNPLLPTSANTYFIYRQYDTAPNNLEVLAGIANGTSFTDTVIQCDDSIKYRIEIGDVLPCDSKSNNKKNFFLNAKPLAPTLNLVSVDLITGAIQISWTASNSPDATGYEVYQVNSGTPTIVATPSGASTTTLNYIGGSPQLQTEQFRVATKDSCNKISNASLVHKTIYLQASLNLCLRQINLTWTNYVNMPSGLKFYEVYVSENGGSYSLLTQTPDTVFIHNINSNPSTYKYYIKAISNSLIFASNSNTSELSAQLPAQPAFLYLKHASVFSDSLVEISFIHDTLAKVQYYKILRADKPEGPFLLVGRVNFSTIYNLKFRDSLAFSDERSYYYKVQTIDSCGIASVESNIGRTIFLKVETSLNYLNRIDWNPYVDWTAGVRYYRVYRSFGKEETFTRQETYDGDVLYSQDFLTGNLSPDGNYCYYVYAYEAFNPIFFISDSSRSNAVCIKQKPRLYIPNAFTPNNDGTNDVFYPQLTFVSDDTFSFIVFDRWGNKLIELIDPTKGWDGKMDNGETYAPGVYAYTIRYTNISGKPDYVSGKIVLMK